jgi:hypothetical protein
MPCCLSCNANVKRSKVNILVLAYTSIFSIVVPFLIGCIRFKKLSTAYYPFLLFIAIGFVNEVSSVSMVRLGYSNNINNNIYCLLRVFLITWQFKNWRLFRPNSNIHWVIIIVSLVFWLAENIYIHFTAAVNSYFIIGSSLLIALLSITNINRLVIREHDLLLTNSEFLISLSWLFYFTFSILTEAFFIYGLAESRTFAERMYSIALFINLFTNLAYGIALLWIPTKPKFILPS